MTHTVTVKETTVFGNKVIKIASIDVTSYTTGGEVISASSLGLSAIESAIVCGQELPATVTIVAETDTSGDYASGSSFHLFSVDLDGTDDIGANRGLIIGHR